MTTLHLLLVAVEAAVAASLVLGLFRARGALGLSPLYVLMGGFQFLTSVRGPIVPVWEGFAIHPAALVLLPANLLALLVVYLKEDQVEARKLVYGLVVAYAGLTLVTLLIGGHALLPGLPAESVWAPSSLAASARLVMRGSAVLLLDMLGLLALFEALGRSVPGVFLRAWASFFAVLGLDSLLFSGFVEFGNGPLVASLLAGGVGLVVLSLAFAAVLSAYVHRAEPLGLHGGDTSATAGIFQVLTYRQKYEIARRRMVFDALTGLHNRLHFDEAAPHALAQARRYREPLSLMILDGDRVKDVNDRFSHIEGDRALKLMGASIAAEVRAADIACRYGGDEFVVVLPRTGQSNARAQAERCHARLRDACTTAEPAYPWGLVTFSVGIASFPEDGDIESIEDLFRIADRRLYAGKRAGGARIVYADPDEPAGAPQEGTGVRSDGHRWDG